MREIFEPIRDHYSFAQPIQELAAQVEFFSESVVNSQHFTVEMFPSWTPTMYINLGRSYHISLDKSVHSIASDADILVLRDCKTIRHNAPGDRIFTIKFRPGGLENILGVSQLQLTRRIVPLSHVLPPVIIDQIKKCNSLYDRKATVENFFVSMFNNRKADHYLNLVRDIITTYQANGMIHNVSQLAERYFVTSRSINRYFHRVIGTSPKDYFSVLRAREALQVYALQEKPFDPCSFGYYDASHFYREASRFTGLPLKVLKS